MFRQSRMLSYAATIAAVVVALVAVANIGPMLPDPAVAMLLYLVPVVLAASQWGLAPAVAAVAVSLFLHDFVLVEPRWALAVDHRDELFAMCLLLFTALVTAHLANSARRSATAIREATIVRRSDDLKTALLRSVTHDLRTPLTSIKGCVSALRVGDGNFTDTDRAELLANIESQTDRLTRLVSNLLDASRLAAGRVALNAQPQDLAEVVARTLDHLDGELGDRVVCVEIPERVGRVLCDEVQLEQVLFNLLENAARYTPPGASIQIRATADGGMVQVEVVDDGPGVSRLDRLRIFAPFERGSLAQNGTGLGLAIARGFVEAHGGRLWLRDDTSRGAAFVFTVPALA